VINRSGQPTSAYDEGDQYEFLSRFSSRNIPRRYSHHCQAVTLKIVHNPLPWFSRSPAHHLLHAATFRHPSPQPSCTTYLTFTASPSSPTRAAPPHPHSNSSHPHSRLRVIRSLTSSLDVRSLGTLISTRTTVVIQTPTTHYSKTPFHLPHSLSTANLH